MVLFFVEKLASSWMLVMCVERVPCSWVSFGRPFYLRTVLPGVPRHWRFPPASWGHSPRLLLPTGGCCLALEATLIRGMPTKPKVFLALPDACGLRSCDRTHLKNGLVPNRTLVGRMINTEWGTVYFQGWSEFRRELWTLSEI